MRPPLTRPLILLRLKLSADSYKKPVVAPTSCCFLLFAVIYWPNNQHRKSTENILRDSCQCLGRICFVLVSTLHIIRREDNMHLEACWFETGPLRFYKTAAAIFFRLNIAY